MKLYILVPILATIKLCSAGWPCCLRGSEEENDDTCGLNQRNNKVDTRLDIAGPNKTTIYTSEHIKNGVKCKRYSPNEGKRITSVVYKSQLLWTTEADENCVFVQSYSGHFTLLTLGTYHNNQYEPKCFEKVSRRWKRMNLEEFNDKLDEMMKRSKPQSPDASSPTATPPTQHTLEQANKQPSFILDLFNPDKRVIEVCKGGNDKANYRGYLPSRGILVSSVVESNTEIWKAQRGEVLEFAGLNFKGDHLLLALDVSTGTSLTVKYFEKIDGKWNDNIPQKEFLQKLYEMRDSKPVIKT